MRICIVGGGKVGYYLAKTLLEHGHAPVVIEQDPATAKRVANSLEVSVIQGDGATVQTLRDAQADTCQAFVCASGKDEVNLVAAQLAKKIFKVQKTIARVNNPKNTAALKKMGVDIVVSSTLSMVFMIEREVESDAVHQLMSLGHGAATLLEIELPPSFKFDGYTLTDLPVPAGCVVISVVRKDSFIIPNGTSKILVGDKLMVAATDSALHNLIESWKIGQ